MLRHPGTWEPLKTQLCHFQRIGERLAALRSPALWLKTILVGPGYRPHMITKRLPMPSPSHPRVRYRTELSWAATAFVFIHFALAIATVRGGGGGEVERKRRRRERPWPARLTRPPTQGFFGIALQCALPYSMVLAVGISSLLMLVSISRVLDAKRDARASELARCALAAVAAFYLSRAPAERLLALGLPPMMAVPGARLGLTIYSAVHAVSALLVCIAPSILDAKAIRVHVLDRKGAKAE